MTTQGPTDRGRHRNARAWYQRPALVVACVTACVVAGAGGATAAGRIFGSFVSDTTSARTKEGSPRPSTVSGRRRKHSDEPRAAASPAPSVPDRASPHATPSPSGPSQAATASAAPTTGPPGVSGTIPASQLPPQIGAVFDSGGLSGSHYCTASVVNSPGGDLIVTAAHCLDSTSDVFIPAYHDGVAPYGVWHLQRIVADAQWTDSSNPDDDVAFAVVAPLDGHTIQSVVGSYSLGVGQGAGGRVTVTGYPETSDDPLTCTNSVSSFSGTQNEIDCTGMAPGTSGSPWVTAGGPGTVMGVIGGYEQGGDTSDVSYSVVFGQAVKNLYEEATS
jgi:V8-like Glu-specific endopeptidase